MRRLWSDQRACIVKSAIARIVGYDLVPATHGGPTALVC